MFSNPNVRVKQTPEGPQEYIDPFADWVDLLFSRAGLAAVVGADIFVNDGGLLGAGFDLVGEVGESISDFGDAL